MSTDKKPTDLVLQTAQLPMLREWYLKVLDARWSIRGKQMREASR